MRLSIAFLSVADFEGVDMELALVVAVCLA